MATETTTSVDITTELISVSSLTYIRPIQLKITASLLKPNTRMYAFFDGQDVNKFFTPEGGLLGDALVTDANGNLNATFDIPSMTFTTGNRELLLIDTNNLTASNVIGTAVIKAKAIFASTGTLETYQTTETTTITITNTIVEPPPNYDPLAQSFFTYGINGGCFITSIDLFFLTKDDILPVWIELREMVNGYPGPNLIDSAGKSIKNSEDVNVSETGTIATNFKFDKLIYLNQDKDYCFIVRSNSNRYNVFTSKLGEKSLETGKVIFEQPYMGSLFKSENNVTWTAEQTEDIKFVMYKAEFDTSTNSTIQVALQPSHVTMDSSVFQTVRGIDKIMVSFPFQHGLMVDSKIAISVDANGVYNGIPGTLLNGEFSVTNIIDEYNVAFYVPNAMPTSTGKITTGGLIKNILVSNKGSGYSDTTPPTVTITGSGTGATASAVVKNGKVEDILILTEGIGYFDDVTVLISGSVGTGAIATAYTSSKFTVTINRIYHTVKPQLNYIQPQGSDISIKLNTTTAFFENGGLSHYGSGKTYDIDPNAVNYLDSNLLIASRFNENALMGGNASALMNINLSSSNSNISPVIDLGNSRIALRTNSINNQKEEVILSTNSSGSITAITMVNPGAGYSTAPEVIITGTGTGATATCTIDNGVVTSVTVTNGGSGYYGIAKVQFIGQCDSIATGTVTMTDYNSELSSDYGMALSRYLTKKQILQNVSYGVRIYATAFSNANSSFEVYIKTSLSSSNMEHDKQEWKMLQCDSARNRSQTQNQFLEYEFYNDDLGQFDVYSLKFVLRTKTPWQPPVINNYRTIILA